MNLAVLGPIRVLRDDAPVDLGTPRQHAVIGALALAQGKRVSVETLANRVWGESPPASATATLHSYIGKLRRILEPGRGPRQTATVLVREHAGYALRIPANERDDVALQQTVTDARATLTQLIDFDRPAAAGHAVDRIARVAMALDDRLSCWRGEPYPELGDDPDAVAERVRLADLRAAARELRIVAGLAIGEHDEVVGELAALCAENPLHERWWSLWAVALFRCGRLPDSLAALQTLRAELADELGLDPSEAVRTLQSAILRRDPALGWPAPSTGSPASVITTLSAEDTPLPAPFARPRWPLVGRDPERRRLQAEAEAAAAGAPGVTVVVGEAGAGKTRLLAAFAQDAAALGFRIGVGRCRDTDQPELWPLAEALAGISGRPTTMLYEELTSGSEFALRDVVVQLAAESASTVATALVVEDLHWAGPVVIRALTALIERLTDQRVLVITTTRPDPPEGSELQRFLRATARGEGNRIELGPLPVDAVEPLAEAVAGSAIGDERAHALWNRTGGNTLYLVELLQSAGAPSGTLADVVLERVGALPAETVEALRAASVLGTSFQIADLAGTTDTDPGRTIELLEPARRAGIVADTGAGFRFGHVIVQEVIYRSLAGDVRADLHRRAAEVAASGDLNRADVRASVQHHLRGAAPADSGTGWRMLVETAQYARAGAHYDEEAAHLVLALDLQRNHRAASARERYELLMLATDAHRWSGDWQGVSDCVDAATLLVGRLGDPADRSATAELAARTLSANLDGALWQVRSYGEVHAPVVDALTEILPQLPPHRTAVRSRALLTLAMELFYSGDVNRIDALVAEALDVARPIDDPRVRVSVQLGAYVARFRPDAATHRAEYLRLARADVDLLGDPRLEMMVATLATGLANEFGDADAVWSGIRALTSRLRSAGLGTAEVVLHTVAAPWHAMAGDDDAAVASVLRLHELAVEVRTPNVFEAAQVAAALACLHADRAAELLPTLDGFLQDSRIPAASTVALLLLRAGERERAAAFVETHPLPAERHTFLGSVFAAMSCEIGLELDRPDLAVDAFRYLQGYSGRMASAGTAAAIGPVDLFLAYGAAVTGDTAAAAAYANAAADQAGRWRLPRIGARIAEMRRRHGF
ncbi:BTAD domain-containing putative transcriptional regulator [Mycolicibacter hiberniae]|uniref:BTAD domain-containing putative transcriptional regulator n=1 Tax=Mycolicibacter hiberniae TaxID=29314 RepID=UPI0013D02189|nr:BTAD domain-containing putative transcriptional regulator [Mycolicibacter hiberniae]MCV7088062.1 AAA family ATPase [Mycolicibacter hiberniae]